MYKSKGKDRRRERLRQPSSSFADYAEISTDEDVGKDFGILINAPISKDGHFVFKSEKDSAWSIDSSECAQHFTLNLKVLSAAINCIPFNKYMNIDERYFTSDQLTSINNTAEKGKAAYNAVLNDLNASSSIADEHTKSETNENSRTDQSKDTGLNMNAEEVQSQSKDSTNLEDIDFLLSLKEPVQNNPMTITHPISISHNIDSKEKPKDGPTKSIDLEKWLDSILDD